MGFINKLCKSMGFGNTWTDLSISKKSLTSWEFVSGRSVGGNAVLRDPRKMARLVWAVRKYIVHRN